MKKINSKNKNCFVFIIILCSLLFIHFSLFISFGYAQKLMVQNESLLQISEPSVELGLIHLKKESRINPETIFSEHKSAFGINKDCEMHLKRTSTDLIGNKHYRFQQYYKNILVESAEYIVHEKDGIAASVNGKIVNDLPVNTTPIISEEQALLSALNYLKADEYCWQNIKLEKELKDESKNSESTYFPKAELVFANIDSNYSGAAKHILAYKFIIFISKPYYNAKAVYADAASGRIVKKLELTDTDCSLTTIKTNYNNNQDICTYTDSFMSGFDMEDDTSPTTIKVYDDNNFQNIFHDADNVWTLPYDLSAGSSLWGIKKSLDIYGTKFNRSGYNNSDGNISIHQGALIDGSSNNASFQAGYGPVIAQCLVGIGSDPLSVDDDWNTLDILGHEFSHGVSTTETSWAGQGGETGTLNEAFSDVMGETIEWYVAGATDWCDACQRTLNRKTSRGRDLANPINSPYGPLPDTYHGKHWEYTSFDNYGVHINLGPLDYAFYLISVGGSGWNSNDSAHAAPGHGCFYYISGIGIEKASRIFYHALHYLGTDSKYIQAHDYTIQSAIDLYGACSFEAVQVAEAWRAVGIGTGSTCFDNYTACGISLFPYTLSFPYYRSNSSFIMAGGLYCAVNVGTSNTVTVTAHDYVQFLPGFNAATGTDFRAYIDPCVITAP